MKRRCLLLVFLLLPACSSAPKPPEAIFGGALKVDMIKPDGSSFEYIKGIFKVEGRKKHFTLYLMDSNSNPAGRVVVDKGKILEENIPFRSDLKEMFVYWPYLFYSGKKRRYSVGENSIEYLENDITQFGELPARLDIRTAEVDYRITIEYGNKSTSESKSFP